MNFRFHPSRLKNFACAAVIAPIISVAAEASAGGFDTPDAERFAKLALECVRKEYPNKLSHTLNSDADVGPRAAAAPTFSHVRPKMASRSSS